MHICPFQLKVYSIRGIISRDISEYLRSKTVDLYRFSEPGLQSLWVASRAIFPPKPVHKDTSSTHHATLSTNACHWIRHHASNPSTNPVKHRQAPKYPIGSGMTFLLWSRDDASNSCHLALLELLEILI